jgi:hypothetical protein
MVDIKSCFEELSCGNKPAQDFCHAIFWWIHMLDDLFDKDTSVPPTAVSGISFNLICNVANNEFFQVNKTVLLPTILLASQAWADSEGFKKKESPLDKIAAQVMKSQHLDIYIHVAFLCGGLLHMNAMSEKYRAYNFDKE